ncbi:MAG TPA: NrtA/SsuA/CpmA family ABC transporter substrate-binding protein [Candidatus Acidoferrales bacterium]|nr:NrtA/SsuA/CpmA family ABC transporter substrate-binding protein [Candidatus Acidoferrales bacterium]
MNRRLLLLLMAILYAAPSFAQDLRRIRYGTTASVSHLPVWVAKDAGYFAKIGLNVEPIFIRGGALITVAIMSGQLQFSGAGAESVVTARIEGGDVVLLACPSDLEPIYLVTRPEIKSAAELKGKFSAVTRLGSSTHFYLRAALRAVGLDPEKDMTLLQLGAGPEMAVALESGRISAAALNIRYALPFLRRNWPVLVDLTKTDLVYPSSCVASSRTFVKSDPKAVADFLSAYVAGIQLIKKDPGFAERSLAKWTREKDPYVVSKSVEVHARIFKTTPYVPDKGIENVIKDLANRRNVPKEFIGRPELFRDNVPLDRALSR